MKASNFVLSIGHDTNKARVLFATKATATNAWLLLASIGIPAALFHGGDGWYPNNMTTAWHKPTGLEWNIPDIKLTQTQVGYKIESEVMRCEFVTTKCDVWEQIAALITEYMDRVEADCWEVA
jgi:hypothetical protein